MPTSQIGARIKALREQYELTQQDLAHVFGFNDRQTVSAIENGTRRLTADELLLVVDAFPVSLDSSLRRTASLLDCTVERVGDLFAEHGLKRPVEL